MSQDNTTLELSSGGSESSFGVTNFAGMAWRRKWLLLLGVTIGGVIGLIYFSRQPEVYQSNASVFVKIQQLSMLPGEGGAAGESIMDDYMTAQEYLLNKPIVAEHALKDERLNGLESLQGHKDKAAYMMQSLSVSRETKGKSGISILKLSYAGPVAEDCPVILKALVDSYRTLLEDMHKSTNSEAMELFKEAKEILKKKIYNIPDDHNIQNADAIFELVDGKHPLQIELNKYKHEQLQLELEQIQLISKIENLKKNLSDLEQAEQQGKDVTPHLETLIFSVNTTVLDSANREQQTIDSAGGLTESVTEMKLQLQDLMEFWGPDSPKVKALRKRIDFLKSERKQWMDSQTTLASESNLSKKEKLKRRAQDFLNSMYFRIGQINLEDKALAKQTSMLEVKLIPIKKQIKLQEDRAVAKQMYDKILQSIPAYDLAKDLGRVKADEWSPPSRAVQIAPRLTPILLMSLFGGLVFGFGLAWLAEMSDKSFRTPEEIRRRLGLPLIGHVPFLPPDDDIAQSIREEDSPMEPSLYTYYKPRSVQAEAFRGIRTALYFNTSDKKHHVLQVTSPNKSDGKSTMAANLAISIAQSGKTVLLIDADFRRPRQHKIFGVPGEIGISSVMMDETELEEAKQSTRVENLHILPCGPRPNNPAELLTSTKFQEFLDLVREQYDFVIVDTPPILVVSDPSVVAPRVDGVLLTIRISKNGRPDAERAKEMLHSLGVDIIGVIVNGVGQQNKYGYNRYYNYQYGYNYSYNYNYSYYKNADGYYEEDEPLDKQNSLKDEPPEEISVPENDPEDHPPERIRTRVRIPNKPESKLWRWMQGWWK